MDKAEKITIVLSLLAATGGIAGLIVFLTFASMDGGLFHGKYIVRSNPHHCKSPEWFNGEQGDRWQCHRCKAIWKYVGYKWERE